MAKIMVVDDSRMIRKTIRMFLESGGHEVVSEASDGEEAINNFIKHKPDLVTMDISMPEVSGLEALREIKKINPAAKVIMVSSLNQKDLVVNAISQGASSYILKPMTKEKIREAVEDALK